MNHSKLAIFSFLKVTFVIFLSITISTETKASNNSSNTNQDSIYSLVDSMPQFPGGEKAMMNFIYQKLKYPQEAYKKKQEGKVIVEFVVNKQGLVTNTKVVRSLSPLLDKEALRVVNSFPLWTPGIQNELNVNVNITLPIIFKYVPIDSTNWDINESTLIIIDDTKMPEGFNIEILNLAKFNDAKVFKPFPETEKERLVKEFGKQAENGVVTLKTKKHDLYYALKDSSNCKENAVTPKYLGGNDALLKHITDSIKYPFVPKRLKTEGKVIVQFTVNSTGKVMDAKTVVPLDYYLDREAIRVINALQNWTPGTLCGKNIDIVITMPVVFKLQPEMNEKVKWEPTEKTLKLLDGKKLASMFDLSWINYTSLSEYKVIEPTTKEVVKQLTKQYGKDAVNGVVLINTK